MRKKKKTPSQQPQRAFPSTSEGSKPSLEKILALLLGLLFFCSPLLLWSHFNDSGKLLSSHYFWPKYFLILSGSLLLLSGYCLQLARDPAWRREAFTLLRHSRLPRLLGGLLLLMLFSASTALVKPAAILEITDYGVIFGATLALVHLFRKPLFRRAVSAGLLAALGVAVLIGFLQYFDLTHRFFTPIRSGRKNLYLGSTFANCTAFSHYLVVSYPFLLASLAATVRTLFQVRAGRFDKARMILLLFQAVLAISLPLLLVLAASRAGIITVCIEIVAGLGYGAWHWRQRRRKTALENQKSPENNQRPLPRRLRTALIGGLASILLILCLSLGGTVFRNLNQGGKSTNPVARTTYYRLRKLQRYIGNLASGNLSLKDLFGGRYHLWCNTVNMIRDRPLLGTGPGNWQFYYPYYHQSCPGTRKTFNFRRRALRAHNDYLQLTAEYGIFAGLLLVFIWLRQLYLILRWRTGKRGDADPLRFALGLSWLAFSLVMLVSFPLQRPYTRFLFFTLLALGEALAGNRPTAEPSIAAPEETPA